VTRSRERPFGSCDLREQKPCASLLVGGIHSALELGHRHLGLTDFRWGVGGILRNLRLHEGICGLLVGVGFFGRGRSGGAFCNDAPRTRSAGRSSRCQAWALIQASVCGVVSTSRIMGYLLLFQDRIIQRLADCLLPCQRLICFPGDCKSGFAQNSTGL